MPKTKNRAKINSREFSLIQSGPANAHFWRPHVRSDVDHVARRLGSNFAEKGYFGKDGYAVSSTNKHTKKEKKEKKDHKNKEDKTKNTRANQRTNHNGSNSAPERKGNKSGTNFSRGSTRGKVGRGARSGGHIDNTESGKQQREKTWNEIVSGDRMTTGDHQVEGRAKFTKKTWEAGGKASGRVSVVEGEVNGGGKMSKREWSGSVNGRVAGDLGHGKTTAQTGVHGIWDTNKYGQTNHVSAGVEAGVDIQVDKVAIGYGVGAGVQAGYCKEENNYGGKIVTPIGAFGLQVAGKEGGTTRVCLFGSWSYATDVEK